MAKISIIVPVYNVAKYLCTCLDSILAQSFSDWECICVDDGSSDGSSEVLNSYAAKDRRIIVTHKQNEGVSIARNCGIELASGEYITFMDADDYLDPNWFMNAATIVVNTTTDVVRFELQRWDGATRPDVAEWDGHFCILNDEVERLTWGWNKFVSNSCGGACNLFVNRAIMHRTVIFPEKMWMKEDRIFCLRVLARSHTIVTSNWPGYHYRIRPGSACFRMRAECDSIRYLSELTSELESQLARLQYNGVAMKISPAITESVFLDLEELMDFASDYRWMWSRALPSAIVKLAKLDFFKPNYITCRWLCGVLFILKCHSMSLLAIEHIILSWIRALKRYAKTKYRICH